MVEFASETKKPFRPAILFIALGVLVVAFCAVYGLIRYQKRMQPPGAPGPIVVEGLLRPGDPNFEYYKNKIRLEDVKAGLGISFSQTRFATVSGIISNEGDRKLVALELHVALFDVYGKLSKEKTAFALRPGAGYSVKPMEPLERRTFSISIENIEQLWNPKQLVVEITGLKYQ